jgi:hypothetical protein
VDHIQGPSPCFAGVFGRFFPKIYIGDAFRGTFRSTQSVVVIPDARANYNFYYETGSTRNYGALSPANGTNANLSSNPPPPPASIYSGTYTGADEDNIQYDCVRWNDRGHGDTSQMNVLPPVSFPSATQAQVELVGATANPLEPPAGDTIAWDMRVVIDDSNPSAPTAIVNYNHTCYPAHIVKVNDRKVYEFIPQYNGLDTIAPCLYRVPGTKIIGQQATPTVVPTQ